MSNTGEKMEVDESGSATPLKNHLGTKQGTPVSSVITSAASECSNSSWAEMESFVIANVSIHPLTLATRQMLTLRYLTPMGEYQEVCCNRFGHINKFTFTNLYQMIKTTFP